jgi:hypothetical protein
MSAITEQLREAAKCAPLWKNIFEAAADEIERLQKKESHLVNVGSVNKIKADAVIDAAYKTRKSIVDGGEKWLCSVADLVKHANQLE